MTELTGSTVYVLGAGASYHTGAPLLADFLLKARLLKEGKRTLIHRASYDRVFAWIDILRAASYYVEFDLDNLEHVFSLAELTAQLEMEESEQRITDLRWVIVETLDTLQLKIESTRILPEPTYASFADKVRRLNEERANRVRPEDRPLLEKDAVVTFNYDVMLDYAMRFQGMGPEYWVTPARPGFLLLKLHGSTNWAVCGECKADLQVVSISPVAEGYSLRPLFPGDVGSIEFAMATSVLPKTKCARCQKTEVLEPFIIPPTWSKRVAKSPLVRVWTSAVQALKSASQIVVVGYSLPNTDTFFQYLLTLGLASNPQLQRVVVVDVDRTEGFQERYRRVFSRSLDARKRLKFLTGTTFQQFVQDHMERVATYVEWTT